MGARGGEGEEDNDIGMTRHQRGFQPMSLCLSLIVCMGIRGFRPYSFFLFGLGCISDQRYLSLYNSLSG